MVVEFQSLKYLNTVGGVQRAKLIHESFSVCIRWVLAHLKDRNIQCKADGKLLDDAGALIIHAKDFAVIAQSFSRYSQGLDVATISLNGKRIEFSPKKDMSFLGFREAIDVGQHERKLAQDKMLSAEANHAFASVPHRLEAGRIVLDKSDFLDLGCIRRYVRNGMRVDPYLSVKTDLGGFTQAEYNRFWEVLSAWSMCASYWYMNYFQSGEDQVGHMPTQVVAKKDFLATISSKAIISFETAGKIVDRLSIGLMQGKADIFLQPLVCNDSVVSWSPYVVQLSLHQRNMLKLMSRTATLTKLAANIIGSRETPFINDIREKMEAHGWVVVTDRKLPDGCGQVDLLAGAKQFPEQLLLIEAKTLLEVDEPNEIRSAAREIEWGQKQTLKIVDWFGRNADTWKAVFPEFAYMSGTTLMPLVITPRCDPGDDVDQAKVPAMAWSTIQLRLKPESWESPERWWKEILDRKWDVGVTPRTRKFETFSIGQTKFRIPIYEYNDEAA